MDSKFQLGTDDAMLLVDAGEGKKAKDEPPAKRGVALAKAQLDLEDEIDRALVKIGINLDSTAKPDLELHEKYRIVLLIGVVAADESARVTLDGFDLSMTNATIDQLRRWCGSVRALNGPEIQKIVFPPRERSPAEKQAMAELMNAVMDKMNDSGFMPANGDAAYTAHMAILKRATIDPLAATKLEGASTAELVGWRTLVMELLPEHALAAITQGLQDVENAVQSKPESGEGSEGGQEAGTPQKPAQRKGRPSKAKPKRAAKKAGKGKG